MGEILDPSTHQTQSSGDDEMYVDMNCSSFQPQPDEGDKMYEDMN